MSRRDKLAGIFIDTSRELAAANFAGEGASTRVLAGPVRTMGLALERMDEEARQLQEALLAGEKIVELDPALVDASFVRDRLDDEMPGNDDLVKSIEANGQEVPILVRRHPEIEGRYQVAYGHRRLRAARLLKRKVRAVIKEMTNDQLVVAQGIENTARRDLSYIERATFAGNLESHGFGREIIMQALSTDKTELSKLLSVAKAVPSAMVSAIGPAPSAGRRRWMDIADKISDPKVLEIVRKAIQKPEFQALTSDERFMAVLAEANRKPKMEPSTREWKPDSGKLTGTIKDNGRSYTLSLKAADEDQGFGAYITDRLDQLYADWKSQQEN